MRRAPCIALAAVVTLGVAGCGTRGAPTSQGAGSSLTGAASSTGPHPGDPVTVTPATGAPATVFTVHFIAPASAGAAGEIRIAYTVSVTSLPGGGCLGPAAVQAGAATKGRRTATRIDPRRLGSRWCPGRHLVRVVETGGPVCRPGTMCPRFVRVIGTVGTGRFTVTR